MSDELARLPPIARALAMIPDGKRGAFFVAATTDGAEVGLHAKLDETWTVEAGASWDRSSKTVASIKLKATW